MRVGRVGAYLRIPLFNPTNSRPSLLKFLSNPMNLLIFHLLANNRTRNGKPIFWDQRMIRSLLRLNQTNVGSFFSRMYSFKRNELYRDLLETRKVKGQEHYTFRYSRTKQLVPLDNFPDTRKIMGYRLSTSRFLFEFNESYDGTWGRREVDVSIKSDRMILVNLNNLFKLLSNPTMRSILSAFESSKEVLTLREVSERMDSCGVSFRSKSLAERIVPQLKGISPDLHPIKVEVEEKRSKPGKGRAPIYHISPLYFALEVHFSLYDYLNILKLTDYGNFLHVSGFVL